MGAAWAVNVVRKEGFRSLQHVTYRFSPLLRKSYLGKVPFIVGRGLLPRPDGRERSTGCPVSLRTWDAGWGAERLSDVLGAGPSTGVFTELLPRKTVVGRCQDSLAAAGPQCPPWMWPHVCCPPLGLRYLLRALEGVGLASAPPLCQGHLPRPNPPSPHTFPAHTDQHSLHTRAITSLGSALQRVGSNHVASLNCSFFASLCEDQMSDT